MIEGVPPRPLVGHQRPWGGHTSRSYADLSGDIALPPVAVQLSPEATQWSLRTRLTGHGHNSNTGAYPHCCEWKDNTHSVRLNGTQIDAWHIWQENDCALNPVYPQGGTWLGSREGWCPGDVVKDHEVTLPGLTSGGTATLDYSITPVPSNNLGMGGGNYVIMYLGRKGGEVPACARTGQTTVDMANGPVQRISPYLDTVKLLESLGAKNNNRCVSC